MSQRNSGIPPFLDAEPSPAQRRFEVALILGSWTVFGIIQTGQQLAYTARLGTNMPLDLALTTAFAGAAVWAVLTLVVFHLARRFPLDRTPRAPAIVVHTLASCFVAFLEVASTFIIAALTGMLGPDGTFMDFFFRGFPFNILVYWMIAGVMHALMYYRRLRLRDVQTARLTSRLAQTELHLLKSQLHPHFLFNALNSVSALMHKDVKAADRMLARLSELLRGALDHQSAHEVSLEEELEFLDAYLEIEQVRLGDRLSVDIDVQNNVRDARVPHMILQPLVENAIRHGIAPRAAPGRIVIRARGRRGMLDLEVIDDGVGITPKRAVTGRSHNGGLGLANTRARLEQLYGASFSFEPKAMTSGGFRVALTIPFRPVSEPVTEEESVET